MAASEETRSFVSVVIATYNMAKYLPSAIGSALAQKHVKVEVIVVDDGSTDSTQSVIKPFLSDPRVKYLHQANKGQAFAKNAGLNVSRSDYVAFLDADDMWMPDKLALQLPLFCESGNIGVVYSRHVPMNENDEVCGSVEHRLYRGHVTEQLFVENFVPFGTAVVRRECFKALGGFREDIRMGIDYDLWLRFSTQFMFDYVDRPLLKYRVWSGQMSNNSRGRYLNAIGIMKKFLEAYPGVVGESVQKEAWAHTYVRFGRCLWEEERCIVPSVSLFLRALYYKPTYLSAWKSMGRSLLGLR
jgi:glycosyltransferase involved in cell wall biosynthesis